MPYGKRALTPELIARMREAREHLAASAAEERMTGAIESRSTALILGTRRPPFRIVLDEEEETK